MLPYIHLEACPFFFPFHIHTPQTPQNKNKTTDPTAAAAATRRRGHRHHHRPCQGRRWWCWGGLAPLRPFLIPR